MRSDQTTCEEDCATVVRNVAAAGLGGRIIFYFRFSPTDSAGLATQTAVLQTAAEGMVRKIFFETYKVPVPKRLIQCPIVRSFDLEQFHCFNSLLI